MIILYLLLQELLCSYRVVLAYDLDRLFERPSFHLLLLFPSRRSLDLSVARALGRAFVFVTSHTVIYLVDRVFLVVRYIQERNLNILSRLFPPSPYRRYLT